MRDIGGVRLAAVGPATAARLKELHLQVDVMPPEYEAKAIANALTQYESIENLRLLLVRADVGTPGLPRLLEERGAIVDDVACYQTLPETEDVSGLGARLVAEGADWLTFTSGSTVQHFHNRFDLPGLLKRFPALRTASIGPETSKALSALGLAPTVEAQPHTMDAMVEGIVKEASASREPWDSGRSS
jgi:uroporphyrinogen III methyltransferase/synthase